MDEKIVTGVDPKFCCAPGNPPGREAGEKSGSSIRKERRGSSLVHQKYCACAAGFSQAKEAAHLGHIYSHLRVANFDNSGPEYL
jgi:hypothetical protein